MRKINLIVMGKTGVGKSTLINALLGEKTAETSPNKAVTQINKVYNKQVVWTDGSTLDIFVYDTVGLEVDNAVSERTINEISMYIDETNKNVCCTEITVVWFCVSGNCSRFEKYEIELIQKLSIEKNIPFIIVLTKCIDNIETTLERSIKHMIPDLPVVRVLAEKYQTRIGSVDAYGLNELLAFTINEYPKMKISITQSNIDLLIKTHKQNHEELEKKGRKCISKYSEKAGKIGWVPGFCIPIVEHHCLKMITEMNQAFGLSIDGEKTDAIIVGIILAPFMAIPLFSSPAASSYVETVGEKYLDALMKLVDKYANYELEKNETIIEELKNIINA